MRKRKRREKRERNTGEREERTLGREGGGIYKIEEK